MKRASGKSNIDIIRGYMNSERPFTQCGYDANVGAISKKEGEEWQDSEGNLWIKKNGYKQKISKKAKYILEQRCSVCDADMKWGNYLDAKVYPKTQRCYECNIEFEGVLKGKGLYKDYELSKLVNNRLSTLRDFKQKITESIEFLENYTPERKKMEFFNSDGTSEVWVDDTARRDEVLEDLRKDLQLVNADLEVVEKEHSELKYDKKIETKIKKEALKKVQLREKKMTI
jgi:hypothetical protein